MGHLLAVAFVLAQDRALELTLSPAQDTVAVGEDIQVEAVLKNTSDKAVMTAPLLFDERAVSFAINVETTPGAGKKFVYAVTLGSLFAVEPPPLEKLTLAPGKSFVSAFRIPATVAGAWTITGKYMGGPDSKPVSVKVTAKDGKTKLGVKITFNLSEKDKSVDKTIIIELRPDEAPGSVMNFVALVNRGFYKGLKLVEVVKNNWIRTGCPNNDGFGDAGYVYRAENKEQETSPNKGSLQFDTGVVALNQHQKMGFQSSQFFIVLRRINFLDSKFTVIGKVDLNEGDKEKGGDILKDLAAKAEPDRETNRPKNDVTIKEMSVIVR